MDKASKEYRESVERFADKLRGELQVMICENKSKTGECKEKDLCGHIEILALVEGRATKIQQQDAGLMLWYAIQQELAREDAAKIIGEALQMMAIDRSVGGKVN
jgi:hypothetical protein